jgi:crotonobetainyl-CoA:carnitine CoA-transferase CaiB-like acyl-CoA transferase
MALSAILLALFHRSRTGRGQSAEVAMFETAASFVLAENICGQAFDPPLGSAVYPRLTAAGRRPCATRDGQLSVIVYTDGQWGRFLRAAKREELLGDARLVSFAARTQNVDFAYGVIESIIATRTTAEWIEVLEESDIPVMPVVSTDDLFSDPHLADAKMFETVDTRSDGRVRLPRTPIEFSMTRPDRLRPAPELGEHSRQVLQEAGYSGAGLDELVISGTNVDER